VADEEKEMIALAFLLGCLVVGIVLAAVLTKD
jgi:hypothetical protein